MIAANGYSLSKISNAAYKPFKLALWELVKKVITLQIALMENDYTCINLLCSNFPDTALNGLNIYFNWYCLAKIQLAQGNETDAKTTLEKALKVAKGDSEIKEVKALLAGLAG